MREELAEADDDVIRAAGAIVWRPGDAGPDIALVHRPSYDDWSFPKGKRRRGEHVVLAAVREVSEETGLRVVLGRPLSPSVYQVGGQPKMVSYWAARAAGPARFVPGDEVDRLSWLPAAQARWQLSYERDVALLEEFLAGPAESIALIVLRHAEALPRSATDPGDLDRPLDARGVAQARLLAAVLACFGRCQVISSAAERCLATVRPYAAAVGAGVEVEPAFTEPAFAEHAFAEPARTEPARTEPASKRPASKRPASTKPASTEPASKRPASTEGGKPERASTEAAGAAKAELATGAAVATVRDRAARRMAGLAVSGMPTLVCAHRENLPRLLTAALTALGAPPPDGPPLAKGSFWVLRSAAGVLVSVERHDIDPLTP